MDKIAITVAYATPAKQFELELEVSAHANIAMAIRASGILEQCDELVLEELEIGIYAKKKALDWPVQAGDRIEIYRPLIIDPKKARRARAKNKS
jgi:uncharacterized protein